MKTSCHPKGRPPHCPCGHLLGLLYQDVQQFRMDFKQFAGEAAEREAEHTIYRDAKYVEEHVGISESTLLRCQRKGQISVAKAGRRGKKYYRDVDVERLKKDYWG